MSHPFGSDTWRYGSAGFAREEEVAASGLFTWSPDAIYGGLAFGRPLWFKTPGGVLEIAGARTGKLTDFLAQNICSGVLTGSTLLILDVKGELAAISRDQTPDQKFCITWNPFGLHGLPAHRINPFSHLRWSSKWLFSDMKTAIAALIPKSGSSQAEYFELNARRIAEALGLTLVRKNGALTLPDLYDAVLLLTEGGERWLDVAWEMYSSDVPLCRSVEAEIDAARADSSGGWKGILGELQKALACLSDPTLRDSLSPPYDTAMEDLCSTHQAYQVYLMCPPEFIEGWAPVLKSIFAGARTLKSRAPSAPRQTWIIDEAARLKGFEEVVQLFTDGAGIGIRPVAVFQDATQMNDLAPNALRKISSSAALQILFGIRDVETAKRVSDMLGTETLFYGDPLQQSRAEVKLRQAVWSVLSGTGPDTGAAEIDQQAYESGHLSVQQRRLRTPDEILNMAARRMVVFADELPGPFYGERQPYWEQPWMAGRYHPNPFHPPLDRVPVQTRWGPRWRPVVTQEVPARYAHYPQYQDGTWSFIGR